ncbi:hypothetical protein AAMO2058_001290100 [Amorphochlora amoebiformis]
MSKTYEKSPNFHLIPASLVACIQAPTPTTDAEALDLLQRLYSILNTRDLKDEPRRLLNRQIASLEDFLSSSNSFKEKRRKRQNFPKRGKRQHIPSIFSRKSKEPSRSSLDLKIGGFVALFSDDFQIPGRPLHWFCLEIMTHLTPIDLVRLSVTCSGLHRFIDIPIFWRTVALRQMAMRRAKARNTGVKTVPKHRFHGSWKATAVLHASGSSTKTAMGVSSQREEECNISRQVKNTSPNVRRICRVDGRRLSREDFISKYDEKGVPVIVTNATSGWPAAKTWTLRRLQLRLSMIRVGGRTLAGPALLPFRSEDFFHYCVHQNGFEEDPLYLFQELPPYLSTF